jgi:hypothetical protein
MIAESFVATLNLTSLVCQWLMVVAVDAPEVTIPTNTSEWSEVVVNEMPSASDLTDAKNEHSGYSNCFRNLHCRLASIQNQSRSTR